MNRGGGGSYQVCFEEARRGFLVDRGAPLGTSLGGGPRRRLGVFDLDKVLLHALELVHDFLALLRVCV